MTGTDLLKRLSIGAATLALLAGGAGIALGKDATVYAPRQDDDTITQRVSYADLNLASPQGRRRMGFRVSYAVRQVCPSDSAIGHHMDDNHCSKTAWAGVRPQMDRAFARATEIAATGSSSIPPVAIAIIGLAAR